MGAAYPLTGDCKLRLGQRVTIAPSYKYAMDWPGDYIIVGMRWDYQRPDTKLDIAIASQDEIEHGLGSTDGWADADLIPA